MSGGIHAYLKKMARLTGRKKSPKLVKKSAPIMLPQEVQHAVDSARYMARTPTQNGPRVIVSMVGLGRLVVQDTTDLEARILRAWPELDPAQVARVIRAINVGVANELAQPGLSFRLPDSAKPWMERFKD
ncbi:hypothetical protein ACPUET_23565 [Paraburkholderia graminis]|uniref:hypothetical protein n=1 Tax=Paraburkholderia graminis TaxID=60548 RepID=UPI003CC0F4A2